MASGTAILSHEAELESAGLEDTATNGVGVVLEEPVRDVAELTIEPSPLGDDAADRKNGTSIFSANASDADAPREEPLLAVETKSDLPLPRPAKK